VEKMPNISLFLNGISAGYENIQGQRTKGQGRLSGEGDPENAHVHVVDKLGNGDFVFAIEGTRAVFQKGTGGNFSDWMVNNGRVTIIGEYSAHWKLPPLNAKSSRFSAKARKHSYIRRLYALKQSCSRATSCTNNHKVVAGSIMHRDNNS
jgi:hypothetical protein